MRKRALIVVALAVAMLSGGIVFAQQQAPWLHIRVSDDGEDGARVNVNVPVSLVQMFADVAEREIEKELAGRGSHVDAHLRDHDIEIADIRRAWHELRDAGDADFVEVQEGDEYVKVSRLGDRIVIDLEQRDGDNDRGRIEVPVAVVDALLEGEGESLNVRAAIDAMIASASGEIAFIEDGRTSVRIWIE